MKMLLADAAVFAGVGLLLAAAWTLGSVFGLAATGLAAVLLGLAIERNARK